VLAALVVGTLWAGGRALGGSEPSPGPERYVVRQGDTLWEIARDLVGSEGDPRPAVEAIREANGLGTRPLLAGESLTVPSR
jgi:Tfp pilus assembly protein FimV